MTIHSNFQIQSLTNTFGQQISRVGSVDILELAVADIVQAYHSAGALLFQGYDANIETFTQFSNKFGQDFMDYTGGVFNRRVINNNPTILSVNDFNDEVKLHGEMYYQKTQPKVLWFFCAHPAAQGGETILCDGVQFFNALSQPLKKLLSQKKLKFRGHLEKDIWIKKYKTDDLNVLKQLCKSNDLHLQINHDESIDIHYICSAIHPSSTGVDSVFINSLLPAKSLSPEAVSFDDDSEIDAEIMLELNSIAEKITLEIGLETGDILMVDNTRIMHGRRAFQDDTRDIYLRLGLSDPSTIFQPPR